MAPPNPTAPKILVLEDELPLSDIIKKRLESSGFLVVTARTANQALDYLEVMDDIRAIWLDHYLIGKETGLDFVAQVRAQSRWRHIPIMVVSNTASPDKKQAYLEFGETQFFVKAEYRLEDIIAELKKTVNGPTN